LLRLAIETAPDVPAMLAAVAALSDDECRLVCLELGLDALWRRRAT
jgi:hypothetical protein